MTFRDPARSRSPPAPDGVDVGLLAQRAKIFAKMFAARRLGRRTVVSATLLLTNRCNMRCAYCFIDQDRPQRELTEREWADLIDELARRGAQSICLMGGEPLLAPFFGVLVDRVHHHGMLCEAVSNGLLVPREIEHVRKLDSLLISLDGAPEAHDYCRRNAAGGGTYRQVIAGIEAARAAGVPTRLNAVLTRKSIADIEHLLDLADRHDLFVTFSPIGVFSWQVRTSADDFLPSDAATREALVRLKTLRQRGRRVLTSLPALDCLIAYPAPYQKIIFPRDVVGAGFSRDFCPFGRTLLYVDANGDFYPCPISFKSDWFRPKSIDDGFVAAWENLASRECVACACPAVFDWNYVTSLRGLGHGLRTTWRQMRSRKARRE